MRAAISEVLETMFFSLAEFNDRSEPVSDYDCGAAISLVNGDRKIVIRFKLKEAFARMITANMLGIDETAVTKEVLEDTLRELANMVGGNYQARLPETAWRLGIPYLESPSPEPSDGESELAFTCFTEPAGAVVVHANVPGEKGL